MSIKKNRNYAVKHRDGSVRGKICEPNRTDCEPVRNREPVRIGSHFLV